MGLFHEFRTTVSDARTQGNYQAALEVHSTTIIDISRKGGWLSFSEVFLDLHNVRVKRLPTLDEGVEF